MSTVSLTFPLRLNYCQYIKMLGFSKCLFVGPEAQVLRIKPMSTDRSVFIDKTGFLDKNPKQ